MAFDTGRGEWDEEYEAKASETKAIPVGSNEDWRPVARPQHSPTRPLNLTAPTDPQARRPSSAGLEVPKFQSEVSSAATNLGTSSFVNNTPLLRAQRSRLGKALRGTTKTATGSSKSEDKWAKTPDLATTRKVRHLTMEAEVSKYLGPHPEDHRFMARGFFQLDNGDIVASQGLNRKWDAIRTACRVYISYNEEDEVIEVRTDSQTDCLEAFDRLRIVLHHAQAEERTFRARYVVEPPAASVMRKDVILINSSEQPNEAPAWAVELSGPCLSGQDIEQWEEKRKEFMASNEKVFADYLSKAFAKLCALNCGMRMRVHFGNLTLSRFRGEMKQPGFAFERFVKMMGEPQAGANFEKKIGGIELGSRIIQKIHQNPDMFCPLDVMIGSLSETKPKQRLLYFTKRGNAKYRLEADIDISTRGEYQLGENALFEDSAMKKRLEVGVFGFGSKLEWGLEVLTKEKLASNIVAIKDSARSLLSSAEVKQDVLGFPYPILGPNRRLNGDDIADIHTMLQYKLIGTPYVLQISLYRSIGTDNVGNCGACMYSKDWDDHLGPVDVETSDRWKMASDLRVLFPPPWSSAVAGGDQTANTLNGVRSLFEAVELVKSFLSEAA